MFYPLFNKVWSYINTCAAVTVGTWVKLPKDCETELTNSFRDAEEVTKDQRKICLIENAKSLAPLVSTVILQSDTIYYRMKNVPNISTMHNFPFWLQQDLHSIYQFWKQFTSIPYSLFSAVKRNSFIHSKFYINFFFTFPAKPKQYFSTNQIARMIILTNQRATRNFLYFCLNFIQF